MAVKKVKISATKRNQHLKSKKKFVKTTNKTINNESKNKKLSENINGKIFKKPLTKLTQKKKKKSGHGGPPPIPVPIEENIDVKDMMTMMEADDIKSLHLNPIINCNNLKFFDHSATKPKMPRKRKKTSHDNEEETDLSVFENEYADQIVVKEADGKELVQLLPIKKKDGKVIMRSTRIDMKLLKETEEAEKKKNEEEEMVEELNENESESEEEVDSDNDVIEDNYENNLNENNKVLTTAELLIERDLEIKRQKYRIGIICSGILEKPDDKMKNFEVLFNLMDDKQRDGKVNILKVRKIAMLSILEVFKDIVPEYRLGVVDLKRTKVKKLTLQRVTFENQMLDQYKRYLQKLERLTSNIIKDKKQNKKKNQINLKLAEIATICLCDLLQSHPYFNFSQNIAQLLVYLLNNYQSKRIRENVYNCFTEIFKTDKKLDLVLYIIRRMNQMIKTKINTINVIVLKTLLSLNISNTVNLDEEEKNEIDMKKKMLHKKRIINLSKREKKREKKLKAIEKEIDETKSEENKKNLNEKLTNIIKILFIIYFRILKNYPNSKLLSTTLEGLAKFAHVINIDYFSDIINILNNLLENGNLENREQLYCIETVFKILSGYGEALNIDPSSFFKHLYKNLLYIHAGKNYNNLPIILTTLDNLIVKKRKNITHQRLLAFIKRIMILSLQLLHNGTLGCLCIAKNCMQLTSSLDVLLDTDITYGNGKYDPELNDPDYCNANCTSLFELCLLVKSYHPTVKKIAKHIIIGLPTTGDGSLSTDLSKLSPEAIFREFDSTLMSFNPAIQLPNKTIIGKNKTIQHIYLNDELRVQCKNHLNKVNQKIINSYNNNFLNFYYDFDSNK